ncbi:MAG: 4-(cytidine 5'-diphospho)-2-C-methyl-D-erythritol kinase [candidate division Zixibacteria bacterium]|nr:4-(cytidine 5'-diphospho)-2-C-methyl-D-erythritol kinase [candidate division Zixibacteria bacterium]
MDSLILKSPAKINLFLEVLRKRQDGYHEILSLMQAVDVCDELVLERRKSGIKVSCDNPDCPTNEGNLAYQAASLALNEANVNEGVSIRIKKRIPISSGLGGGSSNAAATLQGTNRLLELGLSDRRLHGLASRIGSDVPFFLYSGQALARGRGDEIESKTFYRDYWLVLVCPRFQVSSGWAYQAVKISLTRDRKGVNYEVLGSRLGFFEALAHFRNDLEEVVTREHPVVQEIKEILAHSGAVKSSMSGSGPTVYGVFDQKPQAEEVARKLSRGDWQIFLTQPIPGNI